LTDFGLDNYLKLEAKQQPTWADAQVLEQVKKELSVQPPLVFAGEVDTLRERLAQAARGEALILSD
jgi:3-deoxy-7-phosphoheptulonate synthase